MTAPPSLNPAAAPPRPAFWRRGWWRLLLVLALLGAAFALTLMWERSLPELSEAVVAKLKGMLPPYAVAENPLDYTTISVRNPAIVGELMLTMLEDPAISSVVLAIPVGPTVAQKDKAEHIIPVVARATKPAVLVLTGDGRANADVAGLAGEESHLGRGVGRERVGVEAHRRVGRTRGADRPRLDLGGVRGGQHQRAAVEQIAERVGKSASTIRSLLRLQQLPPNSWKALGQHIPSRTRGLV